MVEGANTILHLINGKIAKEAPARRAMQKLSSFANSIASICRRQPAIAISIFIGMTGTENDRIFSLIIG